MIFSPNNIPLNSQTQINNQTQPLNTTQGCTIEKCKYCNKKTKCNSYLVFLMESISGYNNENECPSIDFTAIENQIAKYIALIIEQNTEKVNDLLAVIENKFIESNERIDAIKNEIDNLLSKVELNNKDTETIQSTIDLVYDNMMPQFINTNTKMDNLMENLGVVPVDTVGLTVYDEDTNNDGIILEEKTFFGKPTGKFKEVKKK